MIRRVGRPAATGREGGPGHRRPDADSPFRTGRPAALLLAAAVLSGCGGDAGDTDRATVRDSAGIEIVDNPAEPPERWSLGPQPLLDLGIVEGDEAYQLSDVTDAVWSASDELVVANRGTNELRFYDADGRHVRSVGREGEGPGEFLALASLERRGDSLIAHDGRGWRFTIYSSDGELLGTTPTDAPYIGLLGDGTLVSQAFLPPPDPQPGSFVRREAALLRHAAGVDTAGRFPMFEMWMDPEVPGSSEPVFAADTRVLVTPERILIADNEAYQIRVLGPDGVLERLIRRAGKTRVRTAEEHARFLEIRASTLANATQRERLMPTYHRQPVRPFMPAFGRSFLLDSWLPWLFVDAGGRLWVVDYVAFSDETPTWSVYDPDGRLLAEVPTPVGFALTWADDERVVGIWRDELDVEHVRVYELANSTP